MTSLQLQLPMASQRRYLAAFIVTSVSLIVYWEMYHGNPINQARMKGNETATFESVLHAKASEDSVISQELGQLENIEDIQILTGENVGDQFQLNFTEIRNAVPNKLSLKKNQQDSFAEEPLNLSHALIYGGYHLRSKPYSAYWVDYDAPFLQRLRLYNKAIADLRAKIKTERGFKPWVDPPNSPTVLWGSVDDFLQQLSNFTNIKTVALSWLPDEDSLYSKNLLLADYYQWIASEPLCTWIRTRGFTKARWDAVYNRQCTADPSAAIEPRSLEPVYLHGKPINPEHYWPNKGLTYPSDFYVSPPPHALYLHIAEDTIITNVGDVFSGPVKVVPYTCSHDRSPNKPENYGKTPIYVEVFIISGHWGTAHFHKSVELLPRVGPYLEFLVQNPDIMIHVSETGGMTATILEVLGISRERLISGVTRTKIAYMPQGTPCGFAQVQGTQMLAYHYRKYIRQRLTTQANICEPSNSTEHRQNLVVIHRSSTRRISDSITIEMQMKDLAEEYGLNFCMYHDQKLPSFHDTMVLFNRAALVVAPHGAGESNLMFCEPGTFVVEMVCNPPHVNMCFQHLAHILGQRYHGIPSENGCEGHIEVNAQVVQYVARAYLEQWKSGNR